MPLLVTVLQAFTKGSLPAKLHACNCSWAKCWRRIMQSLLARHWCLPAGRLESAVCLLQDAERAKSSIRALARCCCSSGVCKSWRLPCSPVGYSAEEISQGLAVIYAAALLAPQPVCWSGCSWRQGAHGHMQGQLVKPCIHARQRGVYTFLKGCDGSEPGAVALEL